ncbi:protein phosphatase 2C domain-containing protein [Streptomyces daliensis]
MAEAGPEPAAPRPGVTEPYASTSPGDETAADTGTGADPAPAEGGDPGPGPGAPPGGRAPSGPGAGPGGGRDVTQPSPLVPGPRTAPDERAPSSPARAAELVPRPAHVGEAPPAHGAEPVALPAADPAALSELVPDTVLDGAHYGSLTLRAASVRGEAARRSGDLRADALLTARFGEGENALLMVAVAAGPRGVPGAHRAAREVCQSIGGALGRSHARLVEDIHGGRREALKSGLNRLTDRSYGMLRAQAAALGLRPDQYTADLRCLLLPADPRCSTRVFFGAGEGGLLRLRDGSWQDLEPAVPDEKDVTGAPVVGYGARPYEPTGAQDRAAAPEPTMDLRIQPLGQPPGQPPGPAPAPPDPRETPQGAEAEGFRRRRFRFRASVARPGDTLLLCSPGFAAPMREEPAFAAHLAARWGEVAKGEPPGLAAYLADVQLRARGHDGDRTAVAVWES